MEPHFSFYARKAPEILTLQKAAIAPPVDFKGKGVLPIFEGIGNVKFRRQFGALAVAHFLSIDPHKKSGLHGTKVQGDLLSAPRLGYFEIPDIAAHRIPSIGNVRRIGRFLPIERVGVVGIDGGAKALQLPIGGHGDLVPTAGVKSRSFESQGALFGGAGPFELPSAIEVEVAVTV